MRQFLQALGLCLLASYGLLALASAPVIGSRSITLVNSCPFPVWFGFISGAAPRKGGGGGCSTDADCADGAVCVNRGGGGNQCFWKNPIPADGNFELQANGGVNAVTIPIFQGASIAFSGGVAGRTHCTGSGCETGDCGGGTGGCPNGHGFLPPVTQAEFTLANNGVDFYDVEVINGMNLPVEMKPILSATSDPAATASPYNCGNPGGTQPTTGAGACSWKMVPPSNDFNWVRAGGKACKSDADCSSGLSCGLGFNPAGNPRFPKTCGKLLGFWTADQVCGIDRQFGAPFDCASPLPAPQQGLSLTNLYECAPIGSCYQPHAPNTCCGCANWDQVGAAVPPSPVTQQCNNSNPTWQKEVLPKLLWLKQACPTVYTYPFDDMSSTFTCQESHYGVNEVPYQITFCPDGQTGGI